MTPTRSFSFGVFHDWDPERLLVILTAYLDESGTHDGSPITLMSGWVGKAGRWNQYDKKWRHLLKKRQLSHIHTKDIVQGSGVFSNRAEWPVDRREALFAKAADLAPRHALFGMTVFLRNDDYDQVYANVMARKPRKLKLDTKYGICFSVCIKYIFGTLENLGVDKDLELHLILEQGHNNAGDAQRIFDDVFCKYAPPQHVEAVKSFSFLKKKEAPALQGADLLAYPSLMVELGGQADISPDSAFEAKVPKTNKSCQVHRVPINIAYLEELRDNILEADDQRLAWGRQRNAEIKSRVGGSGG
ncbi:MAG: DUF3800 domain-containing protein [Proteobacteria bacterium]|nr:DUF3800 domain-containing protein [Pseudomonadota bacterium]